MRRRRGGRRSADSDLEGGTGIGQVGRHDNFFELGGDSILSLQIVTKARRAGWKITPRQLFERQTIAALASVAKPLEEAAKTIHEQKGLPDITAPIPMLPIQLDFFAQAIPMRHHWNQAVLLKSRQPLHAAWLDQALQVVAQHHSALHFCYSQQANDQWRQIAIKSSMQDVLWVRQAADAEQLLTLCNEAQRSLNLQQGSLIRAMLVEMADQSQRLLLVVHHLAIDGVSWRILIEDLETAYHQAKNHEAIRLPEVITGYPAWTHRLQQYPDSHAAEFAYWQNQMNVPVSLPCDFPEGSNSMFNRTRITARLDQAQTQALLKDAPAAYRTQVNDLLLTALGSALCQWSGHQKILDRSWKVMDGKIFIRISICRERSGGLLRCFQSSSIHRVIYRKESSVLKRICGRYPIKDWVTVYLNTMALRRNGR